MRLIFSSILLVSSLFAYYAKVEAINTYNIKSDISGKVIDVNRSCEGRFCKSVVIKIDTYQNEIDLKNLQNQLKNYQNILISQKEILKRKKRTYEIYKNLKTKSQADKDLKFYDYQNTLISINQTKNTISNLKAQIAKLKDTIAKKNIKLKNYIYEIDVNKGDYLNPAMKIATTMQIDKVKLVIFVPIDKISSIKNKKIYINNKLSNFKISKIYKVADSKYVTSYKVELIGKYPKISEIVKVEFKN